MSENTFEKIKILLEEEKILENKDEFRELVWKIRELYENTNEVRIETPETPEQKRKRALDIDEWVRIPKEPFQDTLDYAEMCQYEECWYEGRETYIRRCEIFNLKNSDWFLCDKCIGNERKVFKFLENKTEKIGEIKKDPDNTLELFSD